MPSQRLPTIVEVLDSLNVPLKKAIHVDGAVGAAPNLSEIDEETRQMHMDEEIRELRGVHSARRWNDS